MRDKGAQDIDRRGEGRELTLAVLAFVLCLIALVTSSEQAHSQHPIDIQRASAAGEHFKALATSLLVPARRMTIEARIAAAKSAWALGLSSKAGDEITALLREKSLESDQRARLTFMRGVIEYQDERYQESMLYAEKTISLLATPSPLRARAHLLWGQAALRVRAYAQAEERLKKALQEAEANDLPEVHFALGEVQEKLGKVSEAEENFKAIPMDHERTPVAVRHLAAIALSTLQMERAKFWLEKGRAEYPDAFLDSWADYGMLKVVLAEADLHRARQLVDGAIKQYAPSDPWLLLMQATLEQSEWDRRAQLRVKEE